MRSDYLLDPKYEPIEFFDSEEEINDLEYVYNSNKKTLYIKSNTFAYERVGRRTKVINAIFCPSADKISDYALNNCKSLENVKMHDKITEIGEGAFYGCKKLNSVNISKAITRLRLSAFSECRSLEKLTIPENVTSIDFEFFYGCSRLAAFDVAKENQYFSSHYGALYNKDMSTLIRFPTGKRGKAVIPEGVRTISQDAFKDCIFSAVTLPSSLLFIGENAFQNCARLTSITGGNNLDTIADFAFDDCKKLCSFHLPDSINHLGSYIFNGCSSITEINLPDNVIDNIDHYLIAGCDNISKITISENCRRYCESNGVIYTKDKKKLVFALNSLSGEYTADKETEEIALKAFYECQIEKVILPSGLRSIGSGAFEHCELLKEICIPDNVEMIANDTFGECRSLSKVGFPNKLNHIGARAFKGCTSLKEIILPDRILSFGDEPFSECTSMKRFRVYAFRPRIHISRLDL